MTKAKEYAQQYVDKILEFEISYGNKDLSLQELTKKTKNDFIDQMTIALQPIIQKIFIDEVQELMKQRTGKHKPNDLMFIAIVKEQQRKWNAFCRFVNKKIDAIGIDFEKYSNAIFLCAKLEEATYTAILKNIVGDETAQYILNYS